jgi:hypothetical protein
MMLVTFQEHQTYFTQATEQYGTHNLSLSPKAEPFLAKALTSSVEMFGTMNMLKT